MQTAAPHTIDLVLAGGGHAHAVFLRMWAMKPLPGVRVTLVNPAPTAPYTGMLPGYVAGHYTADEVEIDLVRLARFAGARLILDEVTGLDPESSRLRLAGRPPLDFDVCSINIGITSRSGLAEGDGAQRVKPMQPFAEAWDDYIHAVAEGRAEPDAAVIGAGAGGCELALAMHHRLSEVSGQPVRVSVVDRNETVMSREHPALARQLRTQLDRCGVAVLTSHTAERVTAEGLVLDSGETVRAGFAASTAGARPADWLEASGLQLEDGFIAVDETLRSLSHPHILAAGDIAHLSHAPRPKAGVYAVRAGRALHANLTAILSGGDPRAFRPQRDYLKLVSLGERRAAGEKWGIALSAGWLWRWKDRIDRKFMARLSDLPAMTGPDAVRGPVALGVRDMERRDMLCAGCGSKMARSALDDALGALAPPRRADTVKGAGDDAAVLRWGESGEQVVTTDHFRAFTDDGYVLGRILAVHALGDIWAMGAAPQAGLASLTLPPQSATLQSRTAREVLAGMQSALEPAGADLVGGHTAQGAEFTVGLTATGLVPRGGAIGQDGLQPGDALILTKPLGTGTLLAGEMRQKARGRDVAAAFAIMQQESGAAAATLAPHARAMTDITGFGLAGHLGAMLIASRAGAVIDLDRLPVLEGALDLIAAGVVSSIHGDNLAAAGGVLDRSAKPLASPRGQLLFDPQTAGGLLAGVPGDRAETCRAALEAAGYAAAIIGRVVLGPPTITFGPL
ncbi:selenide, water dikinase SelD [Marinicauda sp. Alg238-R41]|uniref:selenide, water dikinase SelD n=1 Tax=Marinicauda sp. Alg238-R41 TaxID=2993447 RepID=UPI0022E801B1|nr:selenide, water dikinase SelD [Marinicauda sp. Alg238-R41]